VAGLGVAEEVAGAADVEVVRGELEARAQRVEALEHLEALLGLRRELAVGRRREQGVGPRLGAGRRGP
jgi:hypothetical protein